MKARSALVAASLWTMLVPAGIAGEEDALHWLQRMSAAMSQMSYQGTFVYIQGDGIETMRITHISDEQGSRERLVSVSGTPREIIRDAAGVRWISADDQAVMADPALGRAVFPGLPLDDAARAGAFYEFRLAGSQRIAGHSGRRLDILPKDALRYGYTLWLETRSAMLLQWRLAGSDGETLARLMFTDLRMGSEVDGAELESPRAEGEFSQVESGIPAALSTSGEPAWQPASLPQGFSRVSHRRQEREDGGLFEHLVYSDGIATISVYVEAADQVRNLSPGLSRLGTTHAYARVADGMFVTVVGDVPASTVKMIGESMAAVSR